MATAILNRYRVTTYPCFGKYIGATGVHFTPEKYSELGFGHTELFPEPLVGVNVPSAEELDKEMAAAAPACGVLRPADERGRPR